MKYMVARALRTIADRLDPQERETETAVRTVDLDPDQGGLGPKPITDTQMREHHPNSGWCHGPGLYL